MDPASTGCGPFDLDPALAGTIIRPLDTPTEVTSSQPASRTRHALILSRLQRILALPPSR